MFRHFGILAIITVIINLAFICGVIYFVFWCLKHFGII